MSIEITIHITDEEALRLFQKQASFYARWLASCGIVDKQAKVAEKIKETIERGFHE